MLKLPSGTERILIIKPSSLGDVVHSLPFLNAIKARFPAASIHWVIAKGLEGILEGHPMIDKLWIVNKDDWKKIGNLKVTVSELKELFKNLKKERYDVAFDLQGLMRSGVITSATGAPARIGFKEAREGSRFFYTHKIEGGKGIHAVDRYLKMADFAGCDISNVVFPLPVGLQTSSSIPASWSSGEYAVIVPGARWKTKKWPAEKFGKLASRLPLKTIIVGGKTDKDIADEIVSLSNGRATSLAGKTDFMELIEVIRHARFIVSNDSGPMHIAAALGVPVFAIFGPTDAGKTGPYGKGHTVIRENISCAPCFRRTCEDLKCMNSLSAERVYRIIRNKFGDF
jgi:lipopolysaccharide heptosyltransferase I